MSPHCARSIPSWLRLLVAQMVVFALLLGAWASPAWASAAVLVVLRSNGGVDTSPYELRLRSELQTEGLDAVVVNANASTADPKTIASRLGTNGILGVTFATEEAVVTVRVNDAALSLEITRSIKVSLTQRDSVAVFALRSVDLFLGAKLELEQQRRLRGVVSSGEGTGVPSGTNDGSSTTAVTAEPKPKEAKPMSEAIPPKEELRFSSKDSNATRDGTNIAPSSRFIERFRLGGGIAMMQFTDKLQRRIAPALSGTLYLSQSWALGLSLSGPYVATVLVNVEASSGAFETNPVTIDQEFIGLDGRYRWVLNEQFELEPNLGLGVARYGASGRSGQTYVGRQSAVFSMFTSIGGAFVWRVSPRVRLVTEIASFVRWQTPRVLADGRDETGTSRLNFWGSFGPAWVF